MKKKVDKKFFICYSLLEAISFLFSVVLFVLSIIHIIKEQAMGNEFFEFFYFAVHLVIHFLALAFFYKAIKNESFVIAPLTHDRYNERMRSNASTIISSVFVGLFIAVLTYALLILFNQNIYSFGFTYTLKLVLVAVSVFMILSLSAFIIYPFIYKNR